MPKKKIGGGVLMNRAGNTESLSRLLSSRSFGSRILTDRKRSEAEQTRIPARILSDTGREINAKIKTTAERTGRL